MAAETSVDAYIPVTLALIKLSLFFFYDLLREVSFEFFWLKIVDMILKRFY